MKKPDLIRHLEGENLGRFPAWMMRQAGRYQASYRKIRERHSFWDMVTRPEVTAEVSLLPRREMPVDGVILFSDILTLPYGLGIGVEMQESIGPVTLSPLRDENAFRVFRDFSPERHVPYVGEALDRIRGELPGEVALLGFAGAPWTVASYLIEGHVKQRRFEHIKNWWYRDPDSLQAALGELARATVAYLKYQIAHGAHVVQVFDTWLSEMPAPAFRAFYRDMLNGMFRELAATGAKVVFFAKQTHHLLEDFADLEAGVLSVDNLRPLAECEKRTGGRFSLQGNLDPVILLGDEATVREKTRELVAEARRLKRPAILNLGHGIFPGTPEKNVHAFVEEATRPWR